MAIEFVGIAIEMVIAAIVVLTIFIGLPWLFLHYLTKNRVSGHMSHDEERMLEDLWRSAKSMETRVRSLEKLMDEDGSAPVMPHPRPTRREFN